MSAEGLPSRYHTSAIFLRWPSVALFCFFAAGFFYRDSLLKLFHANLPLNGLICTFIIFGFLFGLTHLWSLQKGVRFFQSWAPDFEPEQLDNAPFWLYRIFQGTYTADKTDLYRTLLYHNFHKATSYITYLVSICIFLGLIGTFWGLSLTIQGVVAALTSLDFQDADSANVLLLLKEALKTPLSGMQTAFSTSLFGILGALTLGFFLMQIKNAQSALDTLWCAFETHCKRRWITQTERLSPDMTWLEPLRTFWQEMSVVLDKASSSLTLQQKEQKHLQNTMLKMTHALENFVQHSESIEASAQNHKEHIEQIAHALQTFVLRYQNKGLHFETTLTHTLNTFLDRLEEHLSSTHREVRIVSQRLRKTKEQGRMRK